MAATWKIIQTDVKNVNGLNDVVWQVHWQVTSSDAGHTAVIYGADPITFDGDGDFTPYPNLDELTVIDWIKTALGAERLAQIDQFLSGELMRLKSADAPTLPWA